MAYNMVGYIFVFELADISNKDTMQRIVSNADDSQLQLLKISDKSAVIRKGNHEIIFEGNHYDVKEEVTENGCTYYYCMHDNTEEDIYSGLSVSVSSNSEGLSGKQHMHGLNVLKNFAKDFFCQKPFERMQGTPRIQNAFNIDESFSSTVFSSVITPPPKAIVA